MILEPLPEICTGIIAFDFELIFFKSFKSIKRTFLSISTKTGFAPAKLTAFTVPGKVRFGTNTSSLFLIPIDFKARNIAVVPLVQVVTYLIFKSLDIFFSKSLVSFPSLI